MIAILGTLVLVVGVALVAALVERELGITRARRALSAKACPTPAACTARSGCNGACATFATVRYGPYL